MAKQKTQRARFIEAARKLGCCESESAFDRKVTEVGKPKPVKHGAKSRGK